MLFQKPQSDSRGRLSLHYNDGGSKPPPYKSENVLCVYSNKPNLKAPLSKGSWRRKASEGLFWYLLFSGEEKRSKKVAGTLATVSRAKAPGRNYKLLPALATNSPPDYSLNASRPPPYDKRSFAYDKLNYPLYNISLALPETIIGQPRTSVPTL